MDIQMWAFFIIAFLTILCVAVFAFARTWGERGAESTELATSRPPSEQRSESGQSDDRWKRVIVLDCETTGLTVHDRVVALSALYIDLTKVDSVGAFDGQVKFLHRAYNPNRPSHVAAEQVHGLNSAFLARQPLFATEAQEVWDFMQQGNVLVAHNVEFDLGILNREFKRVGLTPLSTETLCTMELWRSRGMQGTAGLRDIAKRLGYEFKSSKHCSLEDVCMCFRL
jgi:DNA polymerase-3 subunit epsilon